MRDGYSLATHTLQIAHLPILPLTAILYVAAKEQPDVTSRQLNSLALVCNWSISNFFYFRTPFQNTLATVLRMLV